jgi:hypothetical protein
VLVEPPNISTYVAVAVTLNWTDVPGTDFYDIQISTEPDFSTTIPYVIPQTNISEMNLPQGALASNTVYYWRVRACNFNGPSDFSEAFSFKTIGTPVEETQNLSGEVDALAASNILASNQAAILKNRLSSAENQMEQGHSFLAAVNLGIFKVRVFVLDISNMLPHSSAQSLQHHADVILGTLNLGFALTQPGQNVPEEYNLSQNYPNPFNPATTIEYTIPAGENVSLKIYDITGREVASLVNNYQDAGTHIVNWNASNFSSGVYIYRLTAGSFTDTKKMILSK